MTIGERIKEKRIEKKMSLDNLAKIAHVARQTIYKYENNIIANIPSDKVEAIANALGVSPSYLMGWEDYKMPQSFSANVISVPAIRNISLELIDSVQEKYPNDETINQLIVFFDYYLKHIDNLLDNNKEHENSVFIKTLPMSIVHYYSLNKEGKSLVDDYIDMIYKNEKYIEPIPSKFIDKLGDYEIAVENKKNE